MGGVIDNQGELVKMEGWVNTAVPPVNEDVDEEKDEDEMFFASEKWFLRKISSFLFLYKKNTALFKSIFTFKSNLFVYLKTSF